MLDLSHKSCHTFWKEYKDKSVYEITCFMESAEDWSIDENTNETLEQAITKMAASIDKIGKIEIKDPSNIIKIIANLKITRTLRILQALDTANPGAASKILSAAEESSSEDEAAKLFLHRNIVFERLRLISRIFSEERMKKIQSVLEES